MSNRWKNRRCWPRCREWSTTCLLGRCECVSISSGCIWTH